jgi:hypothetical protein
VLGLSLLQKAGRLVIIRWRVFSALVFGPAAFAATSWLPVNPGKVRWSAVGVLAPVGNAALRFVIGVQDARLRTQAFDNRLTRRSWRPSPSRRQGATRTWVAERGTTLNLKPFEVRLWGLRSS